MSGKLWRRRGSTRAEVAVYAGVPCALARATISAMVRCDGVVHWVAAKWFCSATSCCSRVMAAQIASSRSVGTAHAVGLKANDVLPPPTARPLIVTAAVSGANVHIFAVDFDDRRAFGGCVRLTDADHRGTVGVSRRAKSGSCDDEEQDELPHDAPPR